MLRKFGVTSALLALCSLANAGNAQAQVRVDRDENGVRVQVPGARVDGQATAIDRTHLATSHRVSKIIGSEVKNSDGTSLGKVDDLVFDNRGVVHYFIMTHGGVLGVGQKYCAVPLRVAAFRRKEETDNCWIELNVSPATLEKAPTFTSDKWPNFQDSVVVKESDSFFLDAPGVKVRADR